MSDYEGRVDLTAHNPLEQGAGVTLNVSLPHFEGEAFGERHTDGKFIDNAAVHAGDRKSPPLATGLDGLPQNVGTIAFEPHRLFGAIVNGIHAGAVRLH